MYRTIIVACLLLACCSGCASIFCGDHKTVNISSDPQGADFEIATPGGRVIEAGRTPANVTLKRGRGYFQAGDYTIRLEKEGYETAERPIAQGFETGWYFVGNGVWMVPGWVIGWLVVDPATGAMWTIEDVYVKLRLKSGGQTQAGPGVR